MKILKKLKYITICTTQNLTMQALCQKLKEGLTLQNLLLLIHTNGLKKNLGLGRQKQHYIKFNSNWWLKTFAVNRLLWVIKGYTGNTLIHNGDIKNSTPFKSRKTKMSNYTFYELQDFSGQFLGSSFFSHLLIPWSLSSSCFHKKGSCKKDLKPWKKDYLKFYISIDIICGK